MSPPFNVTCGPWKNGRCPLHENDCLFTHMDIVRPESTFTFRSKGALPFFISTVIQKTNDYKPKWNTEPELAGRNAAIATAAAAAGFDVTDTTSLLNLIHAIRDADRAIYPDYYDGPGKYKSDLYPDHWVAADMHRRRGVTEYRDLEKIPSVPEFNFNKQRMKGEQLDDDTVSYSTRRSITGANRDPVGPRTSGKRTGDDFTPGPASKIRRITEDHTTVIESYQSTQRTTTNLNQEEYTAHTSARSCTSRLVFGNVTDYLHMTPDRSGKKKQGFQHFCQQSVRTTTKVSLDKVLQNLKLNETNLKKDREILKERWEADVDLQLQTVTNDLQDLRGCFARAENAISEAIAVIEDRVL